MAEGNLENEEFIKVQQINNLYLQKSINMHFHYYCPIFHLTCSPNS